MNAPHARPLDARPLAWPQVPHIHVTSGASRPKPTPVVLTEPAHRRPGDGGVRRIPRQLEGHARPKRHVGERQFQQRKEPLRRIDETHDPRQGRNIDSFRIALSE